MLKGVDSRFALDGGKILKELVQGLPSFEVIPGKSGRELESR